MNELVSIVLPVYNGAKYLRESIDSIIEQTYSDWELLVLDDCSTDNTAEIVAEYMTLDNRIHYFKNDVNLRLPRNLNKGFSLAKGKYLTWTSDDNRYKPKAIASMVNALQNDLTAQFVFASCRIIDSNGNPIEYIRVDQKSPKRIIGLNGVGACFMYTRKLYEEIGDYDPEYTLVEDFDYWQRALSKFKGITISDILYEYRWHDSSLTSTLKKETFNHTLEKMLLKNRSSFGKIDAESNYYFYKGLNQCRENLNDKNNPYKFKYKYYNLIYFLQHRIPDKIRRMLQK